MKRIAIVSTILPETNYSRFLIEAMQSYKGKGKIFVYADKCRDNLKVTLRNISCVWHKNFLYPVEILLQSLRDKIDIINLQFEINMYGGGVSAFIFPLLLFLLSLFKIKTFVTLHAVVPLQKIDKNFLDTFGWQKSEKFLKVIRLCFFLLYKGIGLFSHAIIVHSDCLRDTFRSDYHKKKEIFVIPHGVPDMGIVNDLPLRGELNEAIGERKIILYFGYLLKRKGIECLLDAFEMIHREFKDYVLVLAGGTLQPDYVKKLKAIVKERKLDESIIFTSFLNSGSLGSLFRKAEFMVLPSVYSISASGPFALAISSHKAVVATDVGVFSQEIRNGQNGLLSVPNSVPSLYSNIKKLILDRDLLQKIEKNVKFMHEQRKWSNIALRHFELFISEHKKKLVLLCGAYGYGNPGDGAMLLIMVNYLKKKNPNFEIWANSYNPEYTQKKLGIKTVHTDLNKNILKKILLLSRVDIVIYNGGTQLVEIPFTLLRMLIINTLTKIRGKKVIYFGVGVGYIKSVLLAQFALRKADLIILRDKESEELLHKTVSLKNTAIFTFGDPIFSMEDGREQDANRIFAKEGLNIDDRLMLGVSVRVQNEYKDKLYEIIKALDYIVEKYNIRVVLIPWQKAKLCRRDLMEQCFLYDDDACLKVSELMKYKKNAFCLKGDYTPKELLGIISRMDFILGVPFHFLCMSAMNLKPLLGIDYSAGGTKKIYSLFSDLDQLDYLFANFNCVKSDLICKKFDNLFQHRTVIKHKLEEKIALLKEKSKKSFEYLFNFLQL